MRRGKLQQLVVGCKLIRAANNQSTETPVPLKVGQDSFVLSRLVISFSYDGSFSVFFYACASQSYDASFSYHKAYSNNFKILFINKFILSSIFLSLQRNYSYRDYFFNSAILFSISILASGSLIYNKLLLYHSAARSLLAFLS